MATYTLSITPTYITNQTTGQQFGWPNFTVNDGDTYILNFSGVDAGVNVLQVTVQGVYLYVGGNKIGNSSASFTRGSGQLQYIFTAHLSDFDNGAGVVNANFTFTNGRNQSMFGPGGLDFNMAAPAPQPPPPGNLNLSADSTYIYYGQGDSVHVTYNGSDVTGYCTFSGAGAPYVSGGVFDVPSPGYYDLTATYTYYGSQTVNSNTIYIQAIERPPNNISNAQGCQNANFSFSAYDASNVSVFVNNVNCPVVSNTPLGGNQFEITAFLPDVGWGYGQSYTLAVQANNGSGTGTASFFIPSACQPAPPSAGTLTIYADAQSILTNQGDTIHSSYVDVSGNHDVSGNVYYGGSGAAYMSGQVFDCPTPGQYTLYAVYYYYQSLYVLSNTITITVAAPIPTPVITQITSGCPDDVITIVGKYFVTDIQAYIAGSNELLPMVAGSLTTTNNVDYQFNVKLPHDLSSVWKTQYSVYVTGSTGSSNAGTLSIAGGCGIVLGAPTYTINGPTNLCEGGQHQYTATYNVQGFDANYNVVTTNNDVSAASTWTSDALGDTTMSDGIFNVPGVAGSYHINASWNGYSQSIIVSTASCNANGTPATGTCVELIVTPQTQVVNIGAFQTFTASLVDQYGNSQVITPDYWTVNGIIGGNNAVGTINANGIYTAPSSVPPFVHQEIGAVSGLLSGYGVVALYNAIQYTPNVNITVGSQVNVFFGDGRSGYIPQGATISVVPGDYWIATYQETLDSAFIPLNTGSQQLLHFAYSPQSTSSNVAIYNQGQVLANNDGTFSRTYSIVLGVVDPVSGKFQSAWDINAIPTPIDNQIPAQAPCPHGMYIAEGKTITIEDYATDKLAAHEPVDVTPNAERESALWVGKLELQGDTIKSTDALKLYMLDTTTNSYNLKFVSGNLALQLNGGENLVALPTSAGGWEIQVLSANDNLFESSHTYVLGTRRGNDFYSNWPIVSKPVSKRTEHFEDMPSALQLVINRMKEQNT